MINVDDWAEIRRLYFAERLGIKTIARQLGVARNTVRTAVRGSAPPDYNENPKARWWMPSRTRSVSCSGTARPCRRR